jgi:DeoR/GlpR family transcriptional regulator of sugar metabolism
VWVPVTKAQFFGHIYAERLDVSPSCARRDVTTWELRDRQPVGRSRGYAEPHGTPERWELTADRARRAIAQADAAPGVARGTSPVPNF